jgi:branched-chain amino acid transport system substrate-binding protein
MLGGKIKEFAKVFYFFFFILVVSVAIGYSPKLEREEYITIGALLPLTGESADEGIRAFNGLQLAKEEINKNGGILGKTLDIIVLNDRGDEEYIVQQYNVLKDIGVAAIIGSSYSGATKALAKAAEETGMPIISPTASDPNITKGRRNVFRAIFIDCYQAEVMARFAYKSLDAKTAVVMYNENYDNLRRLAEVFAKSFEYYGGQIIATESYSAEGDFAGILRKYTDNPPDIIFCPEYYVPAAKLVNTAHEEGLYNTKILGSKAWDGILVYVDYPDAMKNVYYPAPFAFDDQNADVAQFVRKYFIAFSQMPLAASATAYTCVYILAEAIEKAGNTNADHIISAVKETDLDMITGNIRFDENNNAITNVYIVQIKDNVYSTYKKISARRGD